MKWVARVGSCTHSSGALAGQVQELTIDHAFWLLRGLVIVTIQYAVPWHAFWNPSCYVLYMSIHKFVLKLTNTSMCFCRSYPRTS